MLLRKRTKETMRKSITSLIPRKSKRDLWKLSKRSTVRRKSHTRSRVSIIAFKILISDKNSITCFCVFMMIIIRLLPYSNHVERKRNSAFLRTTKKGQPILNARMKILYSQIQKSYGNGSGT